MIGCFYWSQIGYFCWSQAGCFKRALTERNNQGKVTFRKGKKAGCIEEKLIREGICEIMEGGEDAFRKRERKYQYN